MLPRPIRIFAITFVALIVLTARPLSAQVSPSLVAETIEVQKGHPLTVALRLEHKAGWHTYWINAGTGYPTTLDWELPPGWTASEISWPAPKTITDDTGHITGQGYDGVVYLPVTLTPPADLVTGTTVTLKAQSAWLMCHDTCVPGKAAVDLKLSVTNTQPVADPVNGPAIVKTLATLPRKNTNGTISAVVEETTVTLHVDGLSSEAAGVATPWWFFPQNDVVAFDQPQTQQIGKDGALTLILPRTPGQTLTNARLQGVLRASPSASIDTENSHSPTALLIDVPLVPAITTVAETNAPTGLLAVLPLAFIGGLILNLMPCVFPVLGIKIMGFVNQSGADRRKITMHGLTFAAGVLVSFWTLATALAVLRAGGSHLGWGFQLQSPVFVFGLATVMLIFALSMSGVCEFGGSVMGTGASLQMQSGYRGSFFTGVLATVVATPCSAPFLAPALGMALAMPLVESYVIFTTIAVGLSTPYLLLSIFPQAVRLLPKPGAWMETFKQAMAFPLYATTGYLVWVLAGQTSESGSLMAIFGLTFIAMATWMYGRYAQLGSSGVKRRIGIIGGITLLTIGVIVGWPHSPQSTDIVWEPWSPARVSELQAKGRPIYVDFTARWCATCQANKKLVFGSNDVLKRFRDLGVVTLRGDWTNRDANITTELARWNRSAVPFNMIYMPGHQEPILLPELLSPKIVLGALER